MIIYQILGIQIMPRLSNKQLRHRKNKGAHQRSRTTRGHRLISKFVKYKLYSFKEKPLAGEIL